MQLETDGARMIMALAKRNVVLVLALLATAACDRLASVTNQSAEASKDATDVRAASGPAATSGSNEASGAPEQDSSGMPVPGTNTPEHIVVNTDADNNTH